MSNSGIYTMGVLETTDELGNAIVPTHTRKDGRLYRYYISTRAIQSGYDESPVRNIPAGEIVRRQLG